MLIIECPHCTTQFRVPAGAIPLTGRDLRCSSCGHQWHYVEPFFGESTEDLASTASDEGLAQSLAPDLSDKDPSFAEILKNTALPDMAIPPVPTGSNPVPPSGVMGLLTRYAPSGLGYVAATAAALVFFWVMAMGQGAVTMIVPRLKVVYELVGGPLPPATPPFTFDRVTFVRESGSIKVTGDVVNQTKSQRNIPVIRAILTEQGEVEPVATWDFRADKTFADVKSSVAFVTTQKDAPDLTPDVLTLEFVSE